ncbi:hypothetical protein HWV62_40296 [Athelia sp. TMB]|nr:hypothetical protein HWV62_40296 [Athelia sp. TMB]
MALSSSETGPSASNSASPVPAESPETNEGEMMSPTARSSFTLLDHEAQSRRVIADRAELDEEIANEEHDIEEYAGDDPHDPKADKIPAPPEEDSDSNVVTWDGPDDPANPKNWSSAFRWFLTCLCCITTLNVTFASSAPSSAINYMAKDLKMSTEVADLVTSLFLVGYIAGPILWGPGSELLGRQLVFRVSMICSTLFILGQSLATNVETLLITRFLAGVFASAPLTNCSGVMADMWDPARRGIAVSLFVACVFIGPPYDKLSGMAAERLRKAEPEKNAALYAEHEKHDWSPRGVLHRTLYRPFYMLYKEPILVLVTIYLSFNYGLLYARALPFPSVNSTADLSSNAVFEAVPIVFVEKRHFGLGADGLMFLGVGVGTCLGAFINFLFARRYAVIMPKWKGFPPPEERLYGAMIAGPSLVIGALWFGWAGQYASVHWVVPALGLILIGLSISLIFSSLLGYLVDTYLSYSASAFAANVMCRSAVAAAFPLFTVQMYGAVSLRLVIFVKPLLMRSLQLGVNWASTLVACVGLILTPSPFLFYKYGPRIRAGSTFAPCIDLKIAKQLAAEERELNQNDKV